MVIGRSVAVCVLPLLVGCAVVATADGRRLRPKSEEFRAYVEQVFREQNRVADEVAFALEASDAERPGLTAAEQRLLEACAGVNELATARRDRESLGARRSLSAVRTVPRCEEAARAATAALAASP